jgi:hypothetical protein
LFFLLTTAFTALLFLPTLVFVTLFVWHVITPFGESTLGCYHSGSLGGTHQVIALNTGLISYPAARQRFDTGSSRCQLNCWSLNGWNVNGSAVRWKSHGHSQRRWEQTGQRTGLAEQAFGHGLVPLVCGNDAKNRQAANPLKRFLSLVARVRNVVLPAKTGHLI